MISEYESRLTSEAEENLLGALLCQGNNGNDAPVEEVSEMLKPSDFSDYAFKGRRSRIFEAMLKAPRKDIVGVLKQLYDSRTHQSLDDPYADNLIENCSYPEKWRRYAAQVEAWAVKRKAK